MFNFVSRFGTFFLVIFFCSCLFQKKASKDASTDNGAEQEHVDTLFASIHRTACYGRCPSYKVEIYESGYAIYEGFKFVEKEGKYTAQLPANDLAYLMDKAKEIGYFQLNDKYDSNVTDLPVCTTSMKDDVRKTIYNRHQGPKELNAFQDLFDQLLDNQTWKKVATKP